MSNFSARVELHGATYQDYENLHRHMAAEGFFDVIEGSDGVWYKLPPAEYQLWANCTMEQVREKAQKAAGKTGKSYAVVVTEYTRAGWSGLSKVQVQASAR